MLCQTLLLQLPVLLHLRNGYVTLFMIMIMIMIMTSGWGITAKADQSDHKKYSTLKIKIDGQILVVTLQPIMSSLVQCAFMLL